MDKTLPKAITGNGSILLDKWWSVIFNTGKYPVFLAVFKACLSIFTGPQVESSFSMMINIINKKSGRMLTETYSGIIGTKYNVMTSGKTSFELFHRKNIFRDTVNGRRLKKCYKLRLKTSRSNVVEKQKFILSNTQFQPFSRSAVLH